MKDEMGVHISKNILYDDVYDGGYGTGSAVSSYERLDKLRKKRAVCAAGLSSEKPILLERGNSRNKHKVKSSNKANRTGYGSKRHRRKTSARVAREFDFSGR